MDRLPMQRLSDLCYIHIAHLLLCRNTEEAWFKIISFESLDISPQFLSNVEEGLPVPTGITSRILNRMSLVVGLISTLLSSWFPRYPLESCLQWVTGDMLYGCLVLKGDGIIDQRKTAEKLLSSRKFDHEFAFRLACVNFLEKEVLQLWVHVRETFLNKIMLKEFVDIIPKDWRIRQHRLVDLPPSIEACTTESREVLFWIGYCLSKEKGIDLKKVPHFAGYNIDWYKHSVESAAFSCNVACFDYFRNVHNPKVEYNYVEKTKTILLSEEFRVPQALIFHLSRLNSEEIAELATNFALNCYCLEWPLSTIFESNPVRLWELDGEASKFWMLLKIFAILFYGNTPTRRKNLSFVLKDWCYEPVDSPRNIKGIYCLDHLRSIWISFWRMSSDPCKLKILDTVVLKSIERASKSRKFSFKFKWSGFKDKLRGLFLSNGKAVLELYDSDKLKESLTNLASKYLLEDFDFIDRNCIAFLDDETEQLVFAEKNPLKVEYKVISDLSTFDNHGVLLDNKFLKYIKRIL